MRSLVELYHGELIPSRAFADGGIHEAIEHYEDIVFYEILAEELALRDMDGEPLTGENYRALMERIDTYLSEFDRHGTDHVNVDLEGGMAYRARPCDLGKRSVKRCRRSLKSLFCGFSPPQLAGEFAPEAGPPDDDCGLWRCGHGGKVRRH